MCLWVSDKKKIWGKNNFFCILKLDPAPDPLVTSADPHQNVTDPQHWFKGSQNKIPNNDNNTGQYLIIKKSSIYLHCCV